MNILQRMWNWLTNTKPKGPAFFSPPLILPQAISIEEAHRRISPLFFSMMEDHEKYGLKEHSNVFVGCFLYSALAASYRRWHGLEAANENNTLLSMLMRLTNDLGALVPPHTGEEFAQQYINMQLLSPRAAIEADYNLIDTKLEGGKPYYQTLANDIQVWNSSWTEFRRSILTDDGVDALFASSPDRTSKAIEELERFKRFRKLMEMTMTCFMGSSGFSVL